MRFSLSASVLALGLLCQLPAAQAQGDASAASVLSTLSVASVVAEASGKAVSEMPAALSTAGAVLSVTAVTASAKGTVVVLERASDGAKFSVEIIGKGVGAVSLAVGTSVTVITLGAGALLSAAGQVVAFIPNAVGRALLHNQRKSQ